MCVKIYQPPSCTFAHPTNVPKPSPLHASVSVCLSLKRYLDDFLTPKAKRALAPSHEALAHFAPDCIFYHELEVAGDDEKCAWCREGQEVKDLAQFGDMMTQEWEALREGDVGLLGDEIKIWDGYKGKVEDKRARELIRKTLKNVDKNGAWRTERAEGVEAKDDGMEFDFTMALRPRDKSINYKV